MRDAATMPASVAAKRELYRRLARKIAENERRRKRGATDYVREPSQRAGAQRPQC